MPQDHVERVRSVYERWGDGDFRASIELFDSQVVLVLGPEFPDAGAHLGIEAITAYTRSLLEPWTRFTIEAEEIVPAGDSVLVTVCQRGIGSASGISTELRYFMLWSFRGPGVIRLESIRERAQALEAAGLPQSP
jgi:ketosteroid isomerase-like protein